MDKPEIASNKLNQVEQIAWISRSYHEARARFFGRWVGAGNLFGIVQMLLISVAYAEKWDPGWGTLFGMLGFISVATIQYLRFDVKQNDHLRMAAQYGLIADRAEMQAYNDPVVADELEAEFQRAQLEQARLGHQYELLTILASNAWLRKTGQANTPFYVKTNWWQRLWANMGDIGVEKMRGPTAAATSHAELPAGDAALPAGDAEPPTGETPKTPVSKARQEQPAQQ